MRIYLQALDYEIWEVVCDGPFMPLTKDEFRENIPKPSREWNDLEKRKASLNSKAIDALFCAPDKKEFHIVSSCESANEFDTNLKLSMKGQIKLKSLKLIDTLVNMNCSKWNKMKICILCILDLRT